MQHEPRPSGDPTGARPVREDRRRPVPGLLVAALGALGVLSALAALAVVTVQHTWGLPPARQVPVDATVGVAYPVMAVVVLSSRSLRPGSRALAWILMLAGTCSGVASLSTALSLGATTQSTAAGIAVQLQGSVWVPGFLPLLTLIPLFYPDGLLPGRLWRWAAAASVIGMTTLTLGLGVYPETFEGRVPLTKPVSDAAVAQGLVLLSAALLLPAVAVALTAPVVRFRRSRGLARRQVTVLLVAAAALALATGAQGLLPTPADVILQALAAGLVPVAIGVAVTRHGLYDLDTAVARTLVAVSLGVCLAGAYLTVFAVLQALPQHRSALSAAVAAGVTGALMHPLATRLTAGVERMYYGDRADPFAVTTELAARLTETGFDVARVPQVVCDTVVEALRLGGAQVSLTVAEVTRPVAAAGEPGPAGAAAFPLRLGGAQVSLTVAGVTRPVAAAGQPGPAGAAAFPLRHGGDVVGELRISPRRGEREVHSRDVVVLRGLADQVAPAVAALQLHRQLQHSREELVSAREGERLQLRRDLHDGLGATLAGLRLQIETARDLAAPTPPGVGDLLRAAGDGVAQAVAEVRAVTEGLRPAGIDDLGLARAIVALADRVRRPGLEVAVEVDPQLAADPAVEVALHRIASEALANAARHSAARHLSLCVRSDDHVELEVRDDGVGLAAGGTTSGSGLGLASMQQRAEEVGGTLEVSSDARGTTVRAVLPHHVGDLR